MRPALGDGMVLAAVALLFRSFGPAPIIATSLAVDAIAVKMRYRLDWWPTALVASVHYAVSTILGITLFNLDRLLGTAPLSLA